MMNAILKRISLIRVIRLIIGLLLLWQAIEIGSWPLIIFAALLTIAPIFNIGCSANGQCAAPKKRKQRF